MNSLPHIIHEYVHQQVTRPKLLVTNVCIYIYITNFALTLIVCVKLHVFFCLIVKPTTDISVKHPICQYVN